MADDLSFALAASGHHYSDVVKGRGGMYEKGLWKRDGIFDEGSGTEKGGYLY